MYLALISQERQIFNNKQRRNSVLFESAHREANVDNLRLNSRVWQPNQNNICLCLV